jgi:hypothetical protein
MIGFGDTAHEGTMQRIAVGQTISRTYGFAFSRYLPNFGVVWLPYLVIGMVAYFFLMPALTALPALLNDIAQHRAQSPGTPFLPPEFGQIMGRIGLFYLFLLIIFPMIAVGITKDALGLRRGPWFVYVSFGKRELLVIAGVLTFAVLYLVGLVVIAIAGGILGVVIGMAVAGSSAGHVNPAAVAFTITAVARVLALVLYLVIIFFTVRLTYFLVPVTTAEGRFGLWRSWQLTGGNFWRIIAIAVATLLPLMILSYAWWYVAIGPEIFTMTWNAQAHPEAANAGLAAMMGIFARYAIFAWVFGLVISPVSYGLMLGQAAIAYRELVPESEWAKP